MRKLPAIAVAAALTIAPLTACGDDTSNESATAACVDAEGVRLPDSACESGDSGNQWLWFLIGTQIGGIGSNLSGGSYSRPSGVNNYYYGGVPSRGGTVPTTGWSGARTKPPKATSTPSPSASKPSATPTGKATTAPAKPSASTSAKASTKPSVKAPAKPNLTKPKAPAAKPPAVKAPAPKAPAFKAPAPRIK